MPSYYLRLYTNKADMRTLVSLIEDSEALSEQSIRDVLEELKLVAIGEAK